ncbi:Urea ABC transporter [Klebsiella pneumoniae subsp. ozaenae]|uniref:Urea ABC transporter n=1 Tax=Klebsiella pneumoniae subsp. ozaenae TaxID=574 RepID=A0A378B3W2_KLEPO|nr:Urea ABC transporter [Klebsiella pneumoniae subsp. ozaenae]
MLQVSQLHQYYGGSHILRGVDFSARQGEVTCLLGRNGVGKTTLLKCLMGLIPARSGEVRWQDQNITHRKPHQRVQAGVAYVPQGREIFPRLTVEEKPADGAVALSRPRSAAGAGGDLPAFPSAQDHEAAARR